MWGSCHHTPDQDPTTYLAVCLWMIYHPLRASVSSLQNRNKSTPLDSGRNITEVSCLLSFALACASLLCVGGLGLFFF